MIIKYFGSTKETEVEAKESSQKQVSCCIKIAEGVPQVCKISGPTGTGYIVYWVAGGKLRHRIHVSSNTYYLWRTERKDHIQLRIN